MKVSSEGILVNASDSTSILRTETCEAGLTYERGRVLVRTSVRGDILILSWKKVACGRALYIRYCVVLVVIGVF